MYYGITLMFIHSSRVDLRFAFGTPFLNQLKVAWQYPQSGLIAFSKPMYKLMLIVQFFLQNLRKGKIYNFLVINCSSK